MGREEEIGEGRYSAEDRLEIVAGVLLGKLFGGVKGLRGEFSLCVRDYIFCALSVSAVTLDFCF